MSFGAAQRPERQLCTTGVPPDLLIRNLRHALCVHCSNSVKVCDLHTFKAGCNNPDSLLRVQDQWSFQ